MSLYRVLGLETSAKNSDIRKAYVALAKRLHPDKNESHTAAEEFAEVHEAYLVLSDPGRRLEYDTHGRIDVIVVDVPSYASITREDIAAFRKLYRFSKDERDDVIRYNAKFGGDLDLAMKYVPCCSRKDKGRFERYVREGCLRDR